MIRLIPLLAAFVVLLWHPTEGWSEESDILLEDVLRFTPLQSRPEGFFGNRPLCRTEWIVKHGYITKIVLSDGYGENHSYGCERWI